MKNMGADSSAENTPNPQFVCPSPKVWDFDEERLYCASVVRAFYYMNLIGSKF